MNRIQKSRLACCIASRFHHPSQLRATTDPYYDYDLLTYKTKGWRYLSSEIKSNSKKKTAPNDHHKFTNLVDGPPIQFGFGKIANLTEFSIIGSTGQSVVLATLAADSLEDFPSSDLSNQTVSENLRRVCKESSSFVPLTVNYKQRHHAVGKIPTTPNRSDNRRPSDLETLASRAIDRALRPLMKPSTEATHLTCSIQACPVKEGTGGNPVALALNAASVAMKDRLKEPVACVYLSLLGDGTVLVDSMPREDSVGELLFAGTRDKVVMMEFGGSLSEAQIVDLIALAHGCIQPLLDTQMKTIKLSKKQFADDKDDSTLRAELGFLRDSTTLKDDDNELDQNDNQIKAKQILEQATKYCKDYLESASLRLFGVADNSIEAITESQAAKIHSESDKSLLSKHVRGRREQLFRAEIEKLLHSFQPDSALLEDYAHILHQGHGVIGDLADAIHSEMLREAMKEAAKRYNSRADGRGKSGDGCYSIRPLSMEVPALPDTVHGSSLFSRGETQVLCTVTLGPPRDGILLSDPYIQVVPASDEPNETKPFQDLPVGSLRYLKNQEHLESDLNSRRVKADREQTGDSGVLRERRRAFLQYDFPAYSKGEVQTGPSGGGSRREIGHGALAEKAILPVLPPASKFPYAIRMTSEVTSSNGSSSMASVCGATLALLDAGVPILSPVAGVSIGLVNEHGNDRGHQLLLDITGTEDYYGEMDFKVAGTDSQVTAFQLDVKNPIPLSVVSQALDLARDARSLILQEMESQSETSSSGIVSKLLPRSEPKMSAPRVEIVRFDATRKKDLLGPGGVVIRQIEDRFDVSLDLTQEGQCLLFGDDREMVRKAKAAVMDLVADVEVGGVYEGTVIELRDFGAIIELLRNKEGLCHISELATRDEIKAHPQGTLGLIDSVLRVGQKIEVECMAVDPIQGTIRLKPARRKEV